jgi:integrase/recombinase XerD
MPDQDRYLQDLFTRYLSRKTRHRRLSEDNADRYRAILTRMFKPLQEAELEVTPRKVGEREIEYLLEYFGELDIDTQKWMFCILHGLLSFHRNNVYKDMMIAWPAETRTRVDWLTPEEAIRMLEAAQGVERIIIHLELRLWLRRCEVLRMTSADIQELMEEFQDLEGAKIEGIVQVHGKGRGGGKWRTLAWAPETRAEVQYYQELRADMLQRGRKADPTVQDPEQWLIYQRGRQVQGYRRTGIDNAVARVAKRAGIGRKVGNHTLRRTGARLAYFAGVKVVEIMEALGHTSEKMTIKYLGLTVAEQGKAQRKVYDYLQIIRARMDLREGEALVTSKEKPAANIENLRVSR